MAKRDWDRVGRERALGTRGGEAAPAQRIRAVPASDKQVARLEALGYRGPRPATNSEVRRLAAELRKQQEKEQEKEQERQEREERENKKRQGLAGVAADITRIASLSQRARYEAVPDLRRNLAQAYEFEYREMKQSRMTPGMDRDLIRRRQRLERQITELGKVKKT
jgi:hypothetical protein